MASVRDRAYDEAVAIDSDEDDEMSTPASSENGSPTASSPAKSAGDPRSNPKPGAGAAGKGPAKEKPAKQPKGDDGSESGDESSSSEDSSSSEEADRNAGNTKNGPAGTYDPANFKDLKVSPEVEELFQYITRYSPHTIELDTPFKPFIPELVPSIGEVDALLKMPLPDGKPNILGLVTLDEPTLNPSDPSVLDIHLRNLSKTMDIEPIEVRSIENAAKCPKEIENWVKQIGAFSRNKPASDIRYSKRMPDIEQLMQVWPAEFETFLLQNELPDFADLDLDLESQIRLFASILDVPVHNQITDTLHVIFTLYSEFKLNQHFSNKDEPHDPYDFSNMQNYGGASGLAQGPASNFYGGQMNESMAPSRAPSPTGMVLTQG